MRADRGPARLSSYVGKYPFDAMDGQRAPDNPAS